MIGYRYWELTVSGGLVPRGALAAPLEHTELPRHATHRATCTEHAEPPEPHCCGISYYATAEDCAEALAVLNIGHEYVASIGEVTGPVCPDTRSQKYMVGGIPRYLPDAMRCAAFRVTHVIADPHAGEEFNTALTNVMRSYFGVKVVVGWP